MLMMALVVNAQRVVEDLDTVYTVHSITQDRFTKQIADWNARDWKMVSPRPVVVDFYADWCVPCRRLDPILRDIAHYYGGEVDFYRINVDKNPDIASVFQVRSIPYLLSRNTSVSSIWRSACEQEQYGNRLMMCHFW